MRKGFTLMELLIVVIVIGILASIGVPQFFRVAERGRTAEATHALGALRSAQIRLSAQNGVTTAVPGALDMNVTNLRFFTTPPTLIGGVDTSVGGPVVIASLTRNATSNTAGFGAYVLSIAVNGDITCAGGAATACQNIGY